MILVQIDVDLEFRFCVFLVEGNCFDEIFFVFNDINVERFPSYENWSERPFLHGVERDSSFFLYIRFLIPLLRIFPFMSIRIQTTIRSQSFNPSVSLFIKLHVRIMRVDAIMYAAI
jgi:hypothetical protein